MFIKVVMFLFLISVLNFADAHPVIYKGGVVVSSANMSSYSDNQLMYSWSNRWALGLNHWRFSKGDKTTEFGLVKLNHLLYRYNGESSQANIYLHGGVGIVDSKIEKSRTKEAYMTGFEADWETRNLYSAIKYYYFNTPQVTELSMAQARLGFSPYEAGFDQLQTWFMVQGMIMPDINPKVMITPMMRFFYKNVLWEMGSSTKGEWMLNLMVHY